MGNINTTFFDNLDAAATWSAGVAFKRSKGLPLDKYSVFETKALAIEYAEKTGAYSETPVSYPGQVIAVAEGNKMVAYVLAENAEGTKLELQQIGIIPTGDDKTIDVTEDGKISLLVADDSDIVAGAQLTLQADGTIKWVKPDTSTAEGQAAAIKALQDTVDGVYNEEKELVTEGLVHKVADLEEKVGEAAEGETAATGLFKVIADEVKRATDAEKALDDAIKAIDFVDNDELADAIKDFATKKELTDGLAEKADKSAYDQTVIDLDNLESKVDAFLSGTGATDALDSLQELIAYIDEHDDVDIAGILEDIQAIENKLSGIDSTVVAYVTAAIDALKIGDYAKAADLTELAGRVTTLEGKVDVDKVSEAIAAAKGEAATDAQNKADKALEDAKKYTDEELADYYTKEEIAGLNHTTKAELEAEAEIARAAEKANADAITAIKADATIVTFKGVEEALAGKQASGDYATNTALNNAVSALEGSIATTEGNAQKGIADAKAAKEAADEAQADANTNALNIQEIEKEINGYTIGEGEEAQVVDGLITKVSNNTARIGALEGTIAEHTTAIGNNATAAANAQSQADEALRVANLKTTMGEVEAKGYAVAETVNAEIAKKTTMAEVEAKGYAVAETVNADLAKKADKETTYTKEDVNGLIAPLATTEALNGVKATAEQGVADAAAAKSVADAAKARIDGFIDGTAEAESAIDTLVEIQQYMNADTLAFTQLSNKVTNIENGTTTVPKATDADTVDGKHASDFETAGAAASALAEAKEYADAIDTGVMSVESLTDLLVITTGENGKVKISLPDEIILDGGGANF